MRHASRVKVDVKWPWKIVYMVPLECSRRKVVLHLNSTGSVCVCFISCSHVVNDKLIDVSLEGGGGGGGVV